VMTATSSTKPIWEAEVTAQQRTIVDEYVDVTRPDGDRIRFRVNRSGGRVVSFTDYREQGTGTAGTTGIWGTLPPQPAARRCSLTPTAFRAELARLAGQVRADEIIESLNR
jgi:hypothetical protein